MLILCKTPIKQGFWKIVFKKSSPKVTFVHQIDFFCIFPL